MKYIDYEEGKQGVGWYAHEGGASWPATPDERLNAFGNLPVNIMVTRNGNTFEWIIRQSRKSGIPYWSPMIDEHNLEQYIEFLGEDKVIQTLQIAANQLGQDLTISQEVRSQDWMKCDEEAIVSRLSRLSARDPDTLTSLRSEMKDLMTRKVLATTEEERKKIDALLLDNLEKQSKKVNV